MKTWCVEYFEEINKWFDSLQREEFISIAKELKLLELSGNELRLPHSRALGNGVFELRERKFGYRIYYGFLPQKRIIMLCAGNKKTQKKDIKTAYHRFSKIA